MIPAANNRDRAQLKEHALVMLNKLDYEGLVILLEELKDRDFIFPLKVDKRGVLRWASSYGYLEIIKYIFSMRINMHDGYEVCLKEAANMGHLKVVKYLVEQGVDVSAKNNCAIKWALRAHRKDVVEYIFDLLNSETKKHIIDWATENGHLEEIKNLKGVNLSPVNHALICAALNGNVNTVKYFHENKMIDVAKARDLKDSLEKNLNTYNAFSLKQDRKNKLELLAYLEGVLKNDFCSDT